MRLLYGCERILQLGTKYTLNFISFVAVYTSTEMCETAQKNGNTYPIPYRSSDPCGTHLLAWATLLPLGTMIGLTTSYMLVDMIQGATTVLASQLARFRRLKITYSYCQRPELQRCTLWNNVGGAAKEIDHIPRNYSQEDPPEL